MNNATASTIDLRELALVRSVAKRITGSATKRCTGAVEHTFKLGELHPGKVYALKRGQSVAHPWACWKLKGKRGSVLVLLARRRRSSNGLIVREMALRELEKHYGAWDGAAIELPEGYKWDNPAHLGETEGKALDFIPADMRHELLMEVLR